MARNPERRNEFAPPSAEELIEYIRSGSLDDRVASLKRIGLLDKRGKVTDRYRNWGNKVPRTLDQP